MSAEGDHVCEDFPSNKRKKSSSYNNMKRSPKHTNRNKSLFTCGSCLIKFRTVCRLHVHLEAHEEGGSYTYDHITKTAFPKYDSVCACTQVEQNIVVLIAQTAKTFDKSTDNMRVNIEGINQRHCEARRKSIRIALLQNKNKTQGKVKETESETEYVYKTSEIKKEGQTENFSVQSKVVVSEVSKTLEGQKTKNVTNKIKRNSQLKKKKAGNADPVQDSVPDDAEASKTCSETEKLSDIDNRNKPILIQKYSIHVPSDKITKVMLDDLKDVEQKMDEMTASEALIAISKSVNGENLKNISDIKTEICCTDVTKHPDGLIVSSETNADSLSADMSEDKEAISDVNEQTLGETEQTVEKSKPLEIPGIVFSKGGQKSIEPLKLTSPQQKPKSVERIDKRECPVCGKRGTRAMLSYHRYLHKEKKELSCDKCGKQFQQPSCLKVHLRVHEENVYECDKCPAKFSRKKYLETHLLKHSGEKPYMCENCGKAYRDVMHLKRHIKHVHEQIRKFECDICNERFFRSDHLKCHRLRHFEPGLRCSLCQKKFKLPADLERHLVVHTGEKNWYCHLCGHGFRYPVPYYNHMKKKHGIERMEAEMWRKKMIEENKKHKEESQTRSASTGMTEEKHGSKRGQNTENQSISGVSVVEYSDISNIGTVEVSTEESAFRKIYVDQEARDSDKSVDTTKTRSSDEVNLSEPNYKVMKKEFVSTSNSIEKPQSFYMQANIKGYRFFRVSNFPDNKSVKVLPTTAQEMESAEGGLQFPLKDEYHVAEDSGTGTNGIVGYDDESHLQDDQIAVMEEETVTEDIGVIPDLEGENMQAVMFIDDNECAGEVVIDQEITI